ncbi:MAG: DUF5050 domain-containing protein [Enterocloster asparagiformis]|nr:DUF5050 domain-containing protein [Enterocloster asparagiformis]
MEMYRCVNCMQEVAKGERFCSHCGFDMGSYVQPPNALKKDTILCGRYLIGRVMGHGGFGVTYVGYDLKLELKVAVKEYFPSGFGNRNSTRSNQIQWGFSNTEYRSWQEGVERFLSEARKMAKLDEVPGIVRVRDSFQENQTAYIVMDFAEGITLKQHLGQNGCMDYPACAALLLPLMDSLEAMHDKGLIHRDISPDNLMVQATGREMRAKLLDFGAAVDIGVRRSGKSESIVKDGYSAPEQYMDDGEIGGWTDVYAMAAVMYNCLTGKRVPAAPERMMKPAPLDMEGIRSKKVREILEKALSIRPEERIRTMGLFREALAGALPSGNRLGIGLLAAAAAFVICAAGAWLYGAKPWLPTVEQLGTSNANMACFAGFAQKIGEHMYYIDGDWNLHVTPYDRVDDRLIVDSEAAYINLGADKVYFLHDNGEDPEEPDSIMEMDFDGTNVKTIDSAEHYDFLQYVRYSGGKEMLYYLKGDEEADDGLLYTLCRYDLKTGREEALLEEKIVWYNLDGRYIYYTVYDPVRLESGFTLKRAYLNGKDSEVINDKDFLLAGFIEDGRAYLLSATKEQLVVCDLDGQPVENPMKEYAAQMYGDSWSYGNGWIYYSPDGSGEIHKIRTDGTGETVIYSGDKVVNIGYADLNWLWFMTLREGELPRTFLMYWDGSNLIPLDDR